MTHPGLKDVRISKWKINSHSLEQLKTPSAAAVQQKLGLIKANRMERVRSGDWTKRVTWIHIPTNDIALCQDVLRQVCEPAQADKLCAEEFWDEQMHEPYDFSESNNDDDASSQGQSIPANSSYMMKKAPFMDPLFYLCEFDVQNAKWDVFDEGRGEQKLKQPEKFVESAILYMPYLHYANLRIHSEETRKRCSPPANNDPPYKHPRRSLDESALRHHTFEALEKRNDSQVVTRFLLNQELRKSGRRLGRSELSLMVVDQLWLWILDEDTLVTSFPRSPGDHKDEIPGQKKGRCQHLHLDCLSREWMNNRGKGFPKGAWRLSRLIIDRATNIFKHAHNRRLDLKYLDHFLASMENERSKCTELFQALHHCGDKALMINSTYPSHKSNSLFRGGSRYPRSAFKIEADIDAVANIRDIEDELRMMLHIVNLQNGVLKNAKNGPWATFKGSLEHFETELEGLCDQAVNIHEKLSQTLELKQTLLSIRQNQIVLAFTITTIVFLPLGFISSLFGMNAAELSDGSPMHLSRIFTYMFPISLAFSLLVLAVALGSDLIAWIYPLWEGIRSIGSRPKSDSGTRKEMENGISGRRVEEGLA